MELPAKMGFGLMKWEMNRYIRRLTDTILLCIVNFSLDLSVFIYSSVFIYLCVVS